MSEWTTESTRTSEQTDRRQVRPSSWLPRDLSAWIDKETLVNLVLSVVQTVEETKLRAAVTEFQGASLPPRMMLALLTAGYAMGICSSQAIASRAGEEPVVRYLCAGRQPTSAEVRRFRNRNRELIARCLETVCLVVWRIRFGGWRLGLPRNSGRVFSGSARYDPLIQIEIKCEVMERLYRAEVEDSCCGETALVA